MAPLFSVDTEGGADLFSSDRLLPLDQNRNPVSIAKATTVAPYMNISSAIFINPITSVLKDKPIGCCLYCWALVHFFRSSIILMHRTRFYAWSPCQLCAYIACITKANEAGALVQEYSPQTYCTILIEIGLTGPRAVVNTTEDIRLAARCYTEVTQICFYAWVSLIEFPIQYSENV